MRLVATLSLALALAVVLVGPAQGAVLVGNQQVLAGADSNPPGVAEAFRTTASASGSVATVSVYVDSGSTASSLVAGLYAASGTHPGALLAKGALAAPTAGAWNTIPLDSSASVVAGATYWIAILGPAGTLRYRDACCGGGSPAETHSVRTLSTLPASWTTGNVYADGPLSAYGSSLDGPALSVTPGSIAFGGIEGAASPAGQTLTITNAGGGLLSWTALASAPWLSVFPAGGVGNGSTFVSASTAGLGPGTYNGSVTVTAAGATGSPALIPVTLTVTRPDATPPNVSISAPTAGTQVSGSTPVSATATDDVGVLGVQFRLDGQALGAEDSAAPYEISWDTRLASNGPHVLTAVARDAAGNTTTSAQVGVSVSNVAPPPPSGLVAAYGFSEGSGVTVGDASGNGNSGSISGATWTSAGRFGAALAFDGTNDLVTIADAASLDLSDRMTLEAWVFPTALGTRWRTAIMKEAPGALRYSIYANTNARRPSSYVSTATAVSTNGTAQLALNAWSHLASTWDGATLRLFVNGTQVSSRAVAGTIPASTGALRLGGNLIWNEYFAGRLDEVRVYARALTATEVQADMNAPVNAPTADTSVPVVSLTAPADGATVSGSTAVSASASDNVGVIGVQFRLDGANLGAEDTSAPYSLTWNTATAANGEHSLTAIARDAAGNTRTATARSVTVANGGAPDETGVWSAPINWPLVAVHMSVLPTGNVLAFDGFDDGPNSERIWNPSTGTFTPVPYGPNLFCAGHVLLPDGRTIVLGGHVNPYEGLRDTSLFNAGTNVWTRGADMAVARWYPTATQLADGRVLVLAGDGIVQDRAGQPPALTDASVNSLPEVYDPVANTWTALTGSRITSPLYPHLFVLSDGRILDAGPDTTTRILSPIGWNWSTLGTSPFDGHSAVMYRPNRIMKSGSWSDVDFKGILGYATHGRTAVLDMNQPSPAWRETAPMTRGRGYHNLTLLPDGTVFASGGSASSEGVALGNAVLPTELWNPDTETWRATAPLTNPRLYHSTALLLPDGRVLMAGGGQLPGSGAVDQRNAEIYSPPYLFKGSRPTIAAAPGTVQYGSSFSVTSPEANRIASVSLIRTPSVTHAFDENQRFQFLPFTRNGDTLTVTAPAHANLAPPGYYMLFVVDTDGVPSVASFVRFPAPWEDTVPPGAPGLLAATPGTGSISLAWGAASDDNGVTRYSVHRSTTPGFTPSPANRIAQPTGTTYVDSGLAPGTYSYRVRAEDGAGNLGPSSNEAAATIAGDSTAPAVTMTAPAGAATVNSSVTVSADATDAVGVVGVQFKLDGANLGAEDATAPYSISWDTTATANGAHTLTAVARDAAGNSTTSVGVQVTVSNAAPPPLRVLLGVTSVLSALDQNAAGLAEAFQYSATATGTASRANVYVDAGSTATTLVAGVYSDSAGRPGTLLAQGTLTPVAAGAWNEVSLPAAALAAGTPYWIAILGPAGSGVVRIRDSCCGGGTKAETSLQTNLTSLPSAWSTGRVWLDGPASAYVSGT